jgi:hypothetical protein
MKNFMRQWTLARTAISLEIPPTYFCELRVWRTRAIFDGPGSAATADAALTYQQLCVSWLLVEKSVTYWHRLRPALHLCLCLCLCL